MEHSRRLPVALRLLRLFTVVATALYFSIRAKGGAAAAWEVRAFSLVIWPALLYCGVEMAHLLGLAGVSLFFSLPASAAFVVALGALAL